jgi:stage V sporulation protein B
MSELDHQLTEQWVAKNTFRVYLAAFCIAPMQYGIRMLLSDHLSLEQVGVFYSMMGLVGMLALYNDLWWKEAIAYFVPQYLAKSDYNSSKTILILTLLLQIISSSAIALALFLGSDRIAAHYFQVAEASYAIKAFGIYLCINALAWFLENCFLVLQQWFRAKMIQIISYVFLFLFVFFVPSGLFSFMGVKSLMTWYILARVASAAVAVISVGYICVRKFRYIFEWWRITRNSSQYSFIMKYALAALFANNIIYLITQIDLQFTNYLFGTEKAALYSYGMMLTNLAITLLTPITALLYPLLSHYDARLHSDGVRRMLYGVVNYAGVVALGISFYLFVYAPDISTLLFGQDYEQAGYIMRWNLPFVVFGLLSGVLYAVYAWLGLIKKRVKMLLWILGTNIVVNILWAWLFGVNGIALALGITRFVMYVYAYYDLKNNNVPLQVDRSLYSSNAVVAIVYLWIVYYVLPYPSAGDIRAKLLYLALVWLFYLISIVLVNRTRWNIILTFIRDILRKPHGTHW